MNLITNSWLWSPGADHSGEPRRSFGNELNELNSSSTDWILSERKQFISNTHTKSLPRWTCDFKAHNNMITLKQPWRRATDRQTDTVKIKDKASKVIMTKKGCVFYFFFFFNFNRAGKQDCHRSYFFLHKEFFAAYSNEWFNQTPNNSCVQSPGQEWRSDDDDEEIEWSTFYSIREQTLHWLLE